jgi:iron complex outermembrane receptor protein
VVAPRVLNVPRLTTHTNEQIEPAQAMSNYTYSTLVAALLLPASLLAQTTTEEKPAEPIFVLEKFVTGRGVGDTLGVLPTEPSQSVFGFGKTVMETPRSLSVVSAEMIAQYGVDNIEGLAAIVPSSYTTSSFGIAGSLDLRGTSGENYFRGMKRIENGGVYPTPIGATDRVEIVRGPPSPVYGPGKIGGYLNFVPKSSRGQTRGDD